MLLRLFFTLLIVTLLAPTAALADDDKPTIALLRFGRFVYFNLSDKGMLDMLQAYGYINDEERAILDDDRDLQGEHINIIWGEAGFDFARANTMVRDALGRGADVLITTSTSVTQLAVNATAEMEIPPPVIFNVVSSPYFAEIASAPCVKPAHVTGSHAKAPYDRIVPLLRLQDPGIQVVGTIFNSNDANGITAVAQIIEIGELLGLQVIPTAVTSVADMSIAAEGLVSRGIEAFILPVDGSVVAGLPAIQTVANEHSLPVLFSAANGVHEGVMIGAGFYSLYQEGVTAARMLIGHLEGEIDIATTGISLQSGLTVALNLDTADEQGFEISEELMELADFVVQDGQSSEGVTLDLPEANAYLPDMPLEERRAADLEFLAALECTPEIIAQQQAELAQAGE